TCALPILGGRKDGLAFDVEAGQDAVEPAGYPPVASTEEGHGGGYDDHADDGRVERDRDREPDAEHLDLGGVTEHERGEDADHDERSRGDDAGGRSEEHTSELQSRENLVCRLLLEKK